MDESSSLANDPDPELAAMADEDIRRLRSLETEKVAHLKSLLVPRDPNDEKNVIVEIRAGTGGDEAALFAAELYRMYTRYAERQRLESRSPLAAPRPTAAAYAKSSSRSRPRAPTATCKYESGVHRVQRVPATESAGPHPHLDRDRGRAA